MLARAMQLNRKLNYFCTIMKKSQPEGLARIQAGGEQSVTPATRHFTPKALKGRQNPPTKYILFIFYPPKLTTKPLILLFTTSSPNSDAVDLWRDCD